jgi:putative membrane protein
LDPAFPGRIEDAVSAAEKGTDADIVVACVSSSLEDQDVPARAGALLGLVVLAVLVYAPFYVPHWAVIVGVGAGFAAAELVLHPRAALRRFLVSRRRIERQVREGAQLVFFEARVTATEKRTGLLLYLSFAERAALILPDMGLQGKVDRSTWQKIEDALSKNKDAATFEAAALAAIAEIGTLLTAALPRTGEKNELPNKPWLRLT